MAATRLGGAEAEEAAAGAGGRLGVAEAADADSADDEEGEADEEVEEAEEGEADEDGEEGAEGEADVAAVSEPGAGGEGSSTLSRNTKPATTRIRTKAPAIHAFALRLLPIVGLSMRPPIPTRCGVKPARRAAGVPS